jgi:hypothetical protein
LKDLENLLLLQIIYSRRQCNNITCLGLGFLKFFIHIKITKNIYKISTEDDLENHQCSAYTESTDENVKTFKKISISYHCPFKNNTPHNANYVASPVLVTAVVVKHTVLWIRNFYFYSGSRFGSYLQKRSVESRKFWIRPDPAPDP